MPILESLELDRAAITDKALASLAKAPKLKSLFLLDCKEITDKGLAGLRAVKNLEELTIASDAITDTGIVSLRDLPRLRILDLVGVPQVTELGLMRLPGGNLEQLRIGASVIKQGVTSRR